MEFIKPNLKIDFVGFRYKAFMISGLIIVAGLIALLLNGGLKMGVDFAGGMLIQVKFDKATSPDDIRDALKGTLSQSFVQQVGAKGDNEYLIRTEAVNEQLESLSNKIENELTQAYGPGQQVLRVEMVGPKVGKDLRQKALYAFFYSLLLIGVYVSGRFEFKWIKSLIMVVALILCTFLLDALGLSATVTIAGSLILTLFLCWVLQLPYALGAIISLLHDMLTTIGMLAIFDKEFTLEVLAALLTLAGYSINDTIIVYDRIRENRSKDRKQSFGEMINMSINQTLSRTVLTSATVFFVVLCLFLFGGTVIHDFCFAMLFGVITGTYSSIYMASPILLFYEELRAKHQTRKRRSTAAARSK
ncbi:MAG: protein translocase subunit SecF [Desulfobacteraceae bacterium]|nr:protein translocase subunit SecF [Desulfobacteraceae bacterium]